MCNLHVRFWIFSWLTAFINMLFAGHEVSADVPGLCNSVTHLNPLHVYYFWWLICMFALTI